MIYKNSNSFFLCTCRQLTVFPINSLRISPIKLKIVMLYHMNNTFRNRVVVPLTEVYKYLKGLSLELFSEFFYLSQNHCYLRSLNVFVSDNPCNRFLLNSTVYQANQLRLPLPSKVKDYPSLQLLLNKIIT